jgi:hypothetical protein
MGTMTGPRRSGGRGRADLRVATFSGRERPRGAVPPVTAQDPVGSGPWHERRRHRPTRRLARCATWARARRRRRGELRRARAPAAFIVPRSTVIGRLRWMIETLSERSFTSGFGGNAARRDRPGDVLRPDHAATLIVRPAGVDRRGAISLEREKQTLDSPHDHPISSLAIIRASCRPPCRGCSCCCSRRSR